jgi:serine phosphatase RsbU (regulator of sigma subunit)
LPGLFVFLLTPEPNKQKPPLNRRLFHFPWSQTQPIVWAFGPYFATISSAPFVVLLPTRASVRMQTELTLARGVQATLVPTVAFQNSTLEIYGKSIPSTEMGGDLIDVIQSDGSLLAYIADISGHGLAAGQLMGMLKTATRVSLQFRQHPVALLESTDRVLPAVKESDMYATRAHTYPALSRSQPGHNAYSASAEPSKLSRAKVRLSMEQFPLGLIPVRDSARQA